MNVNKPISFFLWVLCSKPLVREKRAMNIVESNSMI